MTGSTFDALLERVAGQTTRRTALASLVGGALLLKQPDSSDATEKAERHKDGHHKQRGGQVRSSALLKDISFWVDNRAGTIAISVVYGGWNFPGFGCVEKGTTVIAPGETRRLFTAKPGGYLMINNRYWFQFDNGPGAPPWVSAAWDGQSLRAPQCGQFRRGSETWSPYAMNVHRSIFVSFPRVPNYFEVTRHGDTSTNKIYTVKVPAGISPPI